MEIKIPFTNFSFYLNRMKKYRVRFHDNEGIGSAEFSMNCSLNVSEVKEKIQEELKKSNLGKGDIKILEIEAI